MTSSRDVTTTAVEEGAGPAAAGATPSERTGRQRHRGPARAGTPPGRVVGLDVARGLAVLGMFAAHLAVLPDLVWTEPSTWGALVNGRSSILFATLAGLSIGLMTAGRARRSVSLLQARMKIVTRAGLIMLIGVVLDLLGTPIAVILGVYGLLFLAVLPFVTWSVRRLVVLTVGSAVGGALVFFVLLPQFDFYSPGVTEAALGGMYPAVIWFTFFCAGLTVSRLNLRSVRTQAVLLVTGILLALAGHFGYVLVESLASASTTTEDAGDGSRAGEHKEVDPSQIPADDICYADGTGWYSCGPVDGPELGPDEQSTTLAILVRAMIDEKPHSGTPFEVVGSGGFALAVIGTCLLVCRSRIVRGILWPLGAVGSMALTAYSVHIVVISLGRIDLFATGSSFTCLAFAAGALLLCSVWKAFLGRGPLERLLAVAARKATDLTPDTGKPIESVQSPHSGEAVGTTPAPEVM